MASPTTFSPSNSDTFTFSFDVLLQELKSRIDDSLPAPLHTIANIKPQFVSLTPSRLNKNFPNIKIDITDENQNAYTIEALLDSGASAVYISPSFVEDHGIPTRKVSRPSFVLNADDSLNPRMVTHEACFTSLVQGHRSTEWYFITDLGSKTMVIGMTWLRTHNPEVDWRTGHITFSRCPRECRERSPKKFLDDHLEVASIMTEFPQSICEIFSPAKPIKHAATQWAIEDFQNKKVLTLEDIKKGPFADFLDVFEERMYNELPPHRKWDHKVDLVDDWEKRKWKPRVYPLSYQEQQELDKFLEENLANGRIRPSDSPLASPVFFIKKKDGSNRLIVDYRKLNDLTIKNTYPLPRIDELIQKWKGCKYFTALDIRSGYYNIRMREGDEWKTAFITNRGLFEFLVMAFGKCNAPATFQTMMDSIFIVQIRRGDTNCFIDDIGIGTGNDPTGQRNPEEYAIYVVREILQICREHKLSLKPEKCHFLQKEIPYLGHYISGEGIRPDPVKLAGIKDWPPPRTVSELRSYLGLVGYYRRYMRDFSLVARPLNDLLRKDATWKWEEPQKHAFQELKDILLRDVFLLHPDQDKEFILETDASQFAWGAVLSQPDRNGKWKPIACVSKGFADAETRYDTHDRELLAIIRSLQVFRHWLMGTKQPFIILTDHNNLRYFSTKQFLSARQSRWAEFLAKFDFNLRYRPGRQASVPDKLSRRPDFDRDIPKDDAQILISPEKFEAIPHRINSLADEFQGIPFGRDIFVEQAKDPLILKFNQLPESEEPPNGWSRGTDFWTYRGKIYIPSTLRQTVYKTLHEGMAHPGKDNTLHSIRRDYYWPNMKPEVESWIEQCDACQRHKNRNKPTHGHLKPIDVIPRFWGVVTTDLITGLPPCKGYDSIWTATDKRGKIKHIAPTTTSLDSKGLWDLIVQNIWKHHGTMDKLICDRGPQMSSRFTRDMGKKFGIEIAMSTAYHPQTDGQSERTNQEVEQALRTVVNWHQDDWVDWLPIVEFALNNRYHKGLKTTPFYANYGYHPQIGSLPRIVSPIESVEDFVENLHNVQKSTEKSLIQAAEDMKRFYDKHHGATPEFEVGQKVLLDNSNIALNRPSRKLAEKRSGPFKIIERIGSHAYRLELPPQWKNIHPVFHVSKLDAYREDPANPNFIQPPPDIVEGEPEWEVEKILDSRFNRDRLEYRVKWLGWPDAEISWQDERDLVHSQELIEEFYRDHPGAPRRLPDGSRVGDRVVQKKGRKQRGRKHIGCLDHKPLVTQTDVEVWPSGPMSRDVTF